MSEPAAQRRWLRDLRRPRLWLGLWLVMVGAVVVASLLPSGELPQLSIRNLDKLEHFIAYAVLSAYAVMLLARMRAQALAALGLIVLGLGLEAAQAWITQTRIASSADALANTLGVMAGLLLAATPLVRVLQRIDARLSKR